MEAGTGRIEAGPLFSPGCPMGQVDRLRGIITTSDTDNARTQLILYTNLNMDSNDKSSKYSNSIQTWN